MTHSSTRLRKYLLHPLLLFPALGALLLGIGAVWEAAAQTKENNFYPPPGQLVAANGVNLHLDCRGNGELTFLLDHDRGLSGSSWLALQPELAEFARVCAWDRPGYGYSDSSKLPISAFKTAESLHAALEAAGEKGPYISIGHGYGAFISRAFATRFTEDVQGLILVNALHENMREELPDDYYDFALERAQGETHLGNAARFGLLRLMRKWSPERFAGFLRTASIHYPQEALAAYEREHLRASTWKTSYAEFLALDQIRREFQATPPKHTDLPTAVLLSGDSLAEFLPDELPNGFPIPQAARSWQEMQLDLAGNDGTGLFVLVRNTGHDMPLQQPKAIVNIAAHLYAILTGAPPPGMTDQVSAALEKDD